MAISMRSLAADYGYDESTCRNIWVPAGLDMSWPDKQIRKWVADNVIKPLRETDLKEQMDREKLRKLSAEAALVEMDLQIKMGELVSTDYLESTLSEFFADMKNYMRTIPQKHYIELFESQDALELKQKLSAFIDSTLNEIGNYEYEMPDEQDEITEGTQPSNQEDSTA